MKLQLFCVLIFTARLVFGAIEINTMYVNDDESVYIDSKGNVGINPQKIEMAKTNRESLPAQDFPEGNWGEMDYGCQLSLRLDKQVYTNGESIQAVVLVRHMANVQNYFIAFHHSNKIIASSINYSVYSESNSTIAPKPALATTPGSISSMPSSTGFSVSTHTQRKFSDRLNDMFDLTNGVYFVQASVSGYGQMVDTNMVSQLDTNSLSSSPRIELPKALGKMEFFELKSAKVPIEIK